MIGVSSFVLLVPIESSSHVMIWDENQLKVVLKMDMSVPVNALTYSNEMFMMIMNYQISCCSLF